MVSTQTEPFAARNNANGNLAFRVCGTRRDGQIVRLRSPRCTIGSGPRCTLRLRAPGVATTHCLVLRGDRATVVRRFSPDTRVNGRGFTDAELQPGDRLSVGPIELEYLRDQGAPDGALPSVQEAPPAGTAEMPIEHEAWRRRLEERQRQNEQQAAELEAQRSRAQQQQEEWEASREATEQQLAQRREQLAAAEVDLRAAQAALEEERRQGQQQAAQTEQSLEQNDELDARGKELDARFAEMEAKQAEFDVLQEGLYSERAEWEVRCQQADDDCEQRERGLTQRSEELDGQRAELDRLREQLADEQTRCEQERAEELNALQVRLEAEGEALQRQLQDQQTQAATEASVMTDAADQPEAPSPLAEGDEDESIDAYMSRLMQRVRGVTGLGSSANAPPKHPSARRAVANAPSASTSATAEPGTATPESTPDPSSDHPPGQMAPRTMVPEKLIDLSTMREVANSSAKSHIDRYSTLQLASDARVKLFVAMTALAFGGAMIWMWRAREAGALAFYAALTSFVVAAYWALRYAAAKRQIARTRTGSQKPASKDDQPVGSTDDPGEPEGPVSVEDAVGETTGTDLPADGPDDGPTDGPSA